MIPFTVAVEGIGTPQDQNPISQLDRFESVGWMRVGIFAIDPGTTTAVDVGIWPLHGTAKEAMAGYEGKNIEVSESLISQTRNICKMWEQLLEDCQEQNINWRDVHMVIESYQQRPTPHMVSKEAHDPVRLASMIIGYRLGKSDMYEEAQLGPTIPVWINWQQPSEAMTHATDERLRAWGAWIRGSEHRRDARRHALAFWAFLRARA